MPGIGSGTVMGNSRGEHYVVALELLYYGDEAGALHINDTQKKWCFVSGYMAPPEVWDSFNAAWLRICEMIPDGRTKHFHATDFLYRGPDGRRAPAYRGWGNDDDGRFLVLLIFTIQAHGLVKVGGVVDVDAFRRYTLGERKFLTGARLNENGDFVTRGFPGRPYFVAFHSAVWHALKATAAGAKVHFIFDRNRDHIGWSEELYYDVASALEEYDLSDISSKMGRLGFASLQDEPGLQAADLRVHLWDQIFERGENVSPALLDAAKALEGATRLHNVFDPEHLEKGFDGLLPGVREKLQRYSGD